MLAVVVAACVTERRGVRARALGSAVAALTDLVARLDVLLGKAVLITPLPVLLAATIASATASKDGCGQPCCTDKVDGGPAQPRDHVDVRHVCIQHRGLAGSALQRVLHCRAPAKELSPRPDIDACAELSGIVDVGWACRRGDVAGVQERIVI